LRLVESHTSALTVVPPGHTVVTLVCGTYGGAVCAVMAQNERETRTVSTRRVLQGDGYQQEGRAEGKAVHLVHRRGRVCVSLFNILGYVTSQKWACRK